MSLVGILVVCQSWRVSHWLENKVQACRGGGRTRGRARTAQEARANNRCVVYLCIVVVSSGAKTSHQSAGKSRDDVHLFNIVLSPAGQLCDLFGGPNLRK